MRNLESKPNISINNLGQIAGEIQAANFKNHESCGDVTESLRAYGAPSECYNGAYNGCDKEYMDDIVAIFTIHDLTIQQYHDELSARHLGYNAYKNCLFVDASNDQEC